MKINLNEKFHINFLAGMLLSLTLFFFTPLSIYFNNSKEFNFSYFNVVFSLLILSISVCCVICFLLYFLKNNIYQRAVSLIIAFGVLMWFQSNILLWNYGVIDGRDINWSSYTKNGIIDLTVWGVVIILSLVKYKAVVQYAKMIVIFVILMQTMNLTYTVYEYHKKDSSEKLIIDGSKKYIFSDKQNVIIMVLDTFSTIDLMATFKDNPHLTNIFDGFSWYRNNVGAFYYTYPSLPYLLTGIRYDNSIPTEEYKKKVFLESSLSSIFKKNNYNAELYTFIPCDVYLNGNVASNFIKNTKPVSTIDINLFLDNLCWPTFFKVSPHYLKRFFYRLNSDIDYSFFKNFMATAEVRDIPKTFKMYHLWGMHIPFTFYEKYSDAEYVRETKFSSIRTHQATALLSAVDEFLKKLKSLGIYDNTMIIIIGDHGQYPFIPDVGTPILLIKKLNSKGKLIVSDVPTTIGDVPKTVLDSLNIANCNPGVNIFTLKENTSRERMLLLPKDNNLAILHEGYLPALTKYQVIGKSYELSSYVKTSKVFDYIQPERPTVKTGQIINFTAKGDGTPYLFSGWGIPEENYTWTYGNHSVLKIPLERVSSDIKLNMTFMPFIAKGKLDSQRIKMSINGKLFIDRVLTKSCKDTVSINLPRKDLLNNNLEIAFDLPDATSPKKIGLSIDPRELGIAIWSLGVEKIN